MFDSFTANGNQGVSSGKTGGLRNNRAGCRRDNDGPAIPAAVSIINHY